MRDVLNLDTGAICQDSYIISYPYILKYFGSRKRLSASDFVCCANMVYGWMPRAIKLHVQNSQGSIDRGAELLSLARTRMLCGAEISCLVATVDNSLVGVSKMLHFVAPERYAMWDLKICRFLYGRQANRARVKHVENYFVYLTLLRFLKQDSRFDSSTTRSTRKSGIRFLPSVQLNL
jgi:hypothetical protein